MEKVKILIVDDEPIFVYSLKKHLQNCGYEIVGTASTPMEAQQKISSTRPGLIIMDINLKSEFSGLDLVLNLHGKGKKIPVIFVSSSIDTETINRAKEIENCSFVPKPTDDGFIELLNNEIVDLLHIMEK